MQQHSVEPVRPRRGWRLKAGAALAAAALLVGFVATPTADAQIDLGEVDDGIRWPNTPDFNLIINCPLGGIQTNLAAFTCFAGTGHFFGWWLVPDWSKPPAGHPQQPTKIHDNGSFGTFDDVEDLDATLQALLAVASRGQAANTPMDEWVQSTAAKFVNEVKSPTGATPIDYVMGSLAGGCPSPLEVTARAGYYLWLVGVDPASIGGCNPKETIRAAYDDNGKFGGGLRDTIWSFFAMKSFAAGDPELSAFIDANNDKFGTYIKSTANGDGSFGTAVAPQPIDFRTTAEALMALQAVGVGADDPVAAAALSALETNQNDDGGFGLYQAEPGEGEEEPPAPAQLSTTLLSAPVHGMARSLSSGGATATLNELFDKGAPMLPNGAKNFVGFRAIGALLGNYVLRQPNCDPGATPDPCLPDDLDGVATEGWDGEGRFRTHVGGIDDDPGTPVESLAEIKNTQPTSEATFYLLWWHPIASVVEGEQGNLGGGQPGTVVEPEVAQPTVTG